MTDHAEVLARIRERDHRTLLLVDDLVDSLLEEPAAEIWSGVVADLWREADREGWHSKRYARGYLNTWLRAAEGRGELVSELRLSAPGARFARRYYRRPS